MKLRPEGLAFLQNEVLLFVCFYQDASIAPESQVRAPGVPRGASSLCDQPVTTPVTPRPVLETPGPAFCPIRSLL